MVFFGPEMADWESGDGICEMTGQREMGKSDDEVRKSQREGGTEARGQG